jgi:hypothetical protein
LKFFFLLVILSTNLIASDSTKVYLKSRYNIGETRFGILVAPNLISKGKYPVGKNTNYAYGLELGVLYEKLILKKVSFRNDFTSAFVGNSYVKTDYYFDYSPSINYFIQTSNLVISPQLNLKSNWCFYNDKKEVKDYFGINSIHNSGNILSSYYGWGIGIGLVYKKFDLGLQFRRNYIFYQNPKPISNSGMGFYFDNRFFIIWKLSRKKK